MNLFEQKWRKFLRRVWLFNFIPFVDFVLAAGSLATGGIREDSDFDVIVGCRQGRIFTARFCCWLVFGLFGWRKKKISGHPMSFGTSDVQKLDFQKLNSDRFCFSHFVTPNTYRLSPPYNEYWKMLYQKLAPVYGEPDKIQKFFDSNADWIGSSTSQIGIDLSIWRGRTFNANKTNIWEVRPQRHRKSVWLARPAEYFLLGRFGDWLEKKLKTIQIKRIEKNLKTENLYKPRIIYNDNELEFHPDTKRIEGYCKK
jgi:hypothetical protein